MLAWVVIFRLPARLATQFRHVTKNPSPQVLVDPTLTNCDARNPFRMRFYENCRVSLAPLNIPTLKPAACQRFSAYLFSFHTLAHSFAVRKGSTPFFSGDSALFAKNHPGWGDAIDSSHGFKMNLARASSCPAGDTSRRFHRYSTRPEASPRPRFTSHPYGFLVNYLDPILQRVGPGEHFSHPAQGPRS